MDNPCKVCHPIFGCDGCTKRDEYMAYKKGYEAGRQRDLQACCGVRTVKTLALLSYYDRPYR